MITPGQVDKKSGPETTPTTTGSEVEEAVKRVMPTMHGITPPTSLDTTVLGLQRYSWMVNRPVHWLPPGPLPLSCR